MIRFVVGAEPGDKISIGIQSVCNSTIIFNCYIIREESDKHSGHMNIFILDNNIRKCAEFHADQHVVKMILESTQMLCTVLNENGMEAPYKSTHIHHPCTIWTGKSLSNWKWLRFLVENLNREYKFRFTHTRDHSSAAVARSLPAPPVEDIGLTEFAQAMPKVYRIPGDAVQAYRNFYIAEKAKFATWTKRPVPDWWSNRP